MQLLLLMGSFLRRYSRTLRLMFLDKSLYYDCFNLRRLRHLITDPLLYPFFLGGLTLSE
jgi:hypothetical protein